jgi:YbbR domain-containing protein
MKRNIKSYFSKNWGLKLVSLLLALILWFTLIPEEKSFSEKTLTVPLEIHNIPPQMELVERPIPSVEVIIRAPNRLIPQITSVNVHAVLNLQKASVAQSSYSLNRNMVSIPEGAEVKEIYPSQVNLKLEMTRETIVDVEANLIGELAENYKLARVDVVPSRVLIKGPESKIKEGMIVRTSPIDISLYSETTEVEADLILPNPDLRLASTESKVLVRLLIQREGQEQERNPSKK